jgi:hypothetical protein
MEKKKVAAKIIAQGENQVREVKVFVKGKHVHTIVVPVGQAPAEAIKEQLNIKKSATKKSKTCQHLGPVVSQVKNELCGCANRQESVYQCLHFNKLTTTTQYKIAQPELCCIGCAAGPFSADF